MSAARRVKLAPSLLAADFADIADQIRMVESGGADELHLDSMDGRFVLRLAKRRFDAWLLNAPPGHPGFPPDRPPLDAPVLWIGAGTRDTGISLTKLTFQVTHATDSDTNAERDFILGELKRSGVIGEVRWHQEGERLNLGRVNHYVADHEVAIATLA